MIAFFPDIYPDELIYSQLARYYIRTGYSAYIYAAEDLYTKRTTRPDVEFFNHFSKDALNTITKNITLSDIVLHHTMFPYYARFLGLQRRNRAYNAMLNLEGNYHNLLAIPKNKYKRFLRYCPLCVSDDRKKYSEAYWHRNHQIAGVNICPAHKCYLINSNVAINSDFSPSLIPCEKAVNSDNIVILSDNNIECSAAEYISTVFNSDLNFENPIEIGTFLHSEISYTKYKSPRGQQRNISLLFSDYTEKYMNLKDKGFTECHQMEKLFSNNRINTYEICLLAMFLSISPQRLNNPTLPQKSQEEIFDEKILTLKKQGLNYRQISEKLKASYDFVKYRAKKTALYE